VVIGLLTSADGIPIAHHVFAGGTSDATTLKGVLEDLTTRFAVGRICVVADRGLITDDNIAEVEAAKCDWLFATRLRRRPDVTAVLATASDADAEQWVEVERFSSKVLETSYNGKRYVVVFSAARERRDITRRLQLIAKIETKLLALEARVTRGDVVPATDIAAAAATILARSPVKRLFDVSDIAEAGSSTTTTTTPWTTTRPWPATSCLPPRLPPGWPTPNRSWPPTGPCSTSSSVFGC
jgi:transposase